MAGLAVGQTRLHTVAASRGLYKGILVAKNMEDMRRLSDLNSIALLF